MNKDYLTSPFNDETFSNSIAVVKSIRQNNKILLSAVQNIPKINLSQLYFSSSNVEKIIRESKISSYSNELINSTFPATKFIELYAQQAHVRKIQELTRNYSNLLKSSHYPFKHLYLSDTFESFIKDETINTDEKIETNDLPSNSESEVDIVTKAEKIQALQNAFFEFVVSCKLLKESLNHSISYSFDRLLSNYGFASALSSLIVLVKPNDPLFPIIIFLIMGIVQEIFRKK
ncbi:hypothetical protein [Lactococcus ileimucosae]|uniref:hypothetical protein n=1 Tax=Lactococcus ileimucosae TaxID=2941329 RepID=UPI0020442D3E|nr:hypothetical protein [Lactococcus ileimucosae]